MIEVKLAVLDDHRTFGDSVARALDEFEGIRSIGVANSATAALDLVRNDEPDVLLVDYQLIDATGFDVADLLSAEGLEPRLILLTAYASSDVTVRALEHGFERVLSKEAKLGEIADAVRIPAIRTGTTVAKAPLHFSPRQREVLELMGQGLDPTSIADELFISVHTSRSHVKDVLRILGASTQLSAVTKAIREGYLLPPSMGEVSAEPTRASSGSSGAGSTLKSVLLGRRSAV